MTTVLQKYNLNDFERIKEDGFLFVLPDDTLEIINKIADQVGSQGYIKTPTFHKKNKKKACLKPLDPVVLEEFNKKLKKNDEIKEQKLIVSVDTFKSCILQALNKITDKTYDKLFVVIIENMNLIIDFEEGNSEDTITSVCGHILDYSTSNMWSVKIYAKLYQDLVQQFPVMEAIFKKRFSNYIMLFNKIDKKDSSTDDYNHFCKISLINQKRKCFSLFIIEMYKYGSVKMEDIVTIIISLQSDLIYSVHWNNESSKCEEISENVYLFIANMCKSLTGCSSWSNILENINVMKNTIVSDAISMSNKIKFKHMDMLDIIKKESIYKPPTKL